MNGFGYLKPLANSCDRFDCGIYSIGDLMVGLNITEAYYGIVLICKYRNLTSEKKTIEIHIYYD